MRENQPTSASQGMSPIPAEETRRYQALYSMVQAIEAVGDPDLQERGKVALALIIKKAKPRHLYDARQIIDDCCTLEQHDEAIEALRPLAIEAMQRLAK